MLTQAPAEESREFHEDFKSRGLDAAFPLGAGVTTAANGQQAGDTILCGRGSRFRFSPVFPGPATSGLKTLHSEEP
jgi:hypothetical protein